MKYNELSKSNYETQRYNVLLNVEETGVAQLQPYVDSKGIATIGVGFNLKVKDVRNQVLVNFRLGENVNENPKRDKMGYIGCADDRRRVILLER